MISISVKRYLMAGLTILLFAGCNNSVSAKNANEKTNNAPSQATHADANMSAQEKKVKADLELKLEQLEAKSVRKLPYGDLFEVVLSSNEIVYTNAATDFTLIGYMINNADMSNLTQTRMDELSAIDFKDLPLAQSFTKVKGDGNREIAIFEDPNCSYCKRFRQTLEKTDNVTIHTFVIDILGANSTAISKKILCAKDPVAAWDDWMLSQKLPNNDGNCDTSVLDKNKKLAQQLGVSGTPTIIFTNGKRIPGAPDAQTLENMFNSI